MLRWFLVCVICNSKSFRSLIFKLCIMIAHTLNICLSFLCKFNKHFLILRAVELRHFPAEMLRGCLVCVICNSSSFHSFVFKLCTILRDFKNAPFYILCLFHMLNLRMFYLSYFIILQNGPWFAIISICSWCSFWRNVDVSVFSTIVV